MSIDATLVSLDNDGLLQIPVIQYFQKDVPAWVAALNPGPVGGNVYPSSVVLANFVSQNVKMFQGKRILSLGCGVGLVSATLISVVNDVDLTLTDIDKRVLDLAERTMEEQVPKTPSSHYKVQLLDWSQIAQSELPCS